MKNVYAFVVSSWLLIPIVQPNRCLRQYSKKDKWLICLQKVRRSQEAEQTKYCFEWGTRKSHQNNVCFALDRLCWRLDPFGSMARYHWSKYKLRMRSFKYVFMSIGYRNISTFQFPKGATPPAFDHTQHLSESY